MTRDGELVTPSHLAQKNVAQAATTLTLSYEGLSNIERKFN